MIVGIVCLAALAWATEATAQEASYRRDAQQMLERLISFRTVAGAGQLPAAIDYLDGILRAAGVPTADIALVRNGQGDGAAMAMLVRLRGRDAASRPVLLSAHIDVVDARPGDWSRDPFRLGEEGGYFFGRGVLDNKTGVTALMSAILRMQAAGLGRRRTLVFAFVGDEETGMETTRLIAEHQWVRRADYAINTDAGFGMLSPEGRPLLYLVQGAEKTYATFRLTTTNAGGHSSRPRPDNAIYDLAAALGRIAHFRFR